VGCGTPVPRPHLRTSPRYTVASIPRATPSRLRRAFFRG
jgi:hypothetical protein